MYQVSFSDESVLFFKSLPQEQQLALIDNLGRLTPPMLEECKEPLARFKHKDGFFYRFKYVDLRLYFTLHEENIRCEFIINKNTWADFKVRNGLQAATEIEVESKPEFISLLKDHK